MGVSLLEQLVEIGVALRLFLVPSLDVVSHVVLEIGVETTRWSQVFVIQKLVSTVVGYVPGLVRDGAWLSFDVGLVPVPSME